MNIRRRWNTNPARTLDEEIATWLAQATVGVRPKTVVCNRYIAATIRRNWPEALAVPCQDISGESVIAFTQRIAGFCASRYNHILNVIIVLVPNAGFLRRRQEQPKVVRLPTDEQLQAMLKTLDSCRNPRAGQIVRLLVLTGMRIGEATNLRRSDLLPDGILVRSEHCKTGRARLIPYLGECKRILADLIGADGEMVIGQLSVRKALRRACKDAGIPHLSVHDFRRLFATKLIQSGVDLPTSARWMGHSDGGVLLGKTYFHLMSDHARLMADRVKISV